MGLSSSKKTSTSKATYEPQIMGAQKTLTDAYSTAAPGVQANAESISNLVPSLLERYKTGDPTINAAQGYTRDVLGGNGGFSYQPDAYLSGLRDRAYTPNSYFSNVMNGTDGSNTSLDAMIALTNNSVANTTNAKLGTRGLTGGTVQSNVIARALADNETGLRYQDFSTQQQRRDAAAAQEAGLAQAYAARQDQAALTEAQRRDQMMAAAAQERAQAAGLAPNLVAANESLLQPALTAANAGIVPFQLAQNYASGTGGLLGQYGTTKEKSKGSLLDSIGKIAQIAGTAASFSDARLKENARRVGSTDAGLPIYVYNYIGDDRPQMGVMAQDVAQLQPNALGPVVDGFGTVRYGEVR